MSPAICELCMLPICNTRGAEAICSIPSGLYRHAMRTQERKHRLSVNQIKSNPGWAAQRWAIAKYYMVALVPS